MLMLTDKQRSIRALRCHVSYSLPSIPADRLIGAECDPDEQNPEKPPDHVHAKKMVTIVKMKHARSPCVCVCVCVTAAHAKQPLGIAYCLR